MRNPFRRLGSQEVYTSPLFKVREDDVEKTGGARSVFPVIEMVEGSCALPLHENGDVVLALEWKYAVERSSIEVAGGAREADESPLTTAQRELGEELGLIAAEWIALGTVDPFTTQCRGPVHLFLARSLTPSQKDPDEGEIIRCIRMPLREAVSLVMRGEITNAASCTLILKASEWLRARNDDGNVKKDQG